MMYINTYGQQKMSGGRKYPRLKYDNGLQRGFVKHAICRDTTGNLTTRLTQNKRRGCVE